MNLKLKRATRTPYSEEILIYDVENRDENDEPVNIGKLDVHYVEDQLVGTLLIWQEYATGYNRTHAAGSDENMDTLIDVILSEVIEPIGVSSEYGIEVYFPSVNEYQFISNYADEAGTATDTDVSEYAAEGDEYSDGSSESESVEESEGDDFAKQLRTRS